MSFLPPGPGLLPKWQLLAATMALVNTSQNYLSLTFSRKVYNNPVEQVTALQARLFGIWTLTSAVVRFYSAYNISQKAVYDMAMFTYLIAFGHFFTELVFFRTTKGGVGVVSPLIVASSSLLWMLIQYDFYVRG